MPCHQQIPAQYLGVAIYFVPTGRKEMSVMLLSKVQCNIGRMAALVRCIIGFRAPYDELNGVSNEVQTA